MWRRYGERLYTVVMLGLVALQTIALGVLAVAFLLRLTGVIRVGRFGTLALAALITTAVALAILTVLVLGYHALTSDEEGRAARDRGAWTTRWSAILIRGTAPPAVLVRTEAIEALLDMRDSLRGREGERAAALIRSYGVVPRLIERARRVHFPKQIRVLDMLSRARAPEALSYLLEASRDPDERVRIVAVRAAARTLAVLPAGADRGAAEHELATIIADGMVSTGVIEQALLLADDAASGIIGDLLEMPLVPPDALRAAIDVAGTLRLERFSASLGVAMRHGREEVRAAAIRAAASIGRLPAGGRASLQAAASSEVEFLRTQGTRALWLLGPFDAEPMLWERLGDPSWWVRRAAGQALLALGEEGRSMLERAGMEHPDRYGRQMAQQVARHAALFEPAATITVGGS